MHVFPKKNIWNFPAFAFFNTKMSFFIKEYSYLCKKFDNTY